MAKQVEDSQENKLDILIVLLARHLYGERKLSDIALPLANMGLSVEQIALVLETSPKNVANRLGELRRAARSRSDITE